MKFMLKAFDFFIKSSIWVSMSVCALALITYLDLELIVSNSLLLFVFFATIVAYNFVKYFEIFSSKGFKVTLSNSKNVRLNLIFVFSTICLLLSGFYFLKLKTRSQVFLLIPFLLTVFYTISFGKKTLRSLAGLKIYVIGICWAFVTVLLPILNAEVNMFRDAYIELFQRFLFVIVITLPFEIRDLNTDSESLGTIPQKVGVKYTKLLGLGLLIVFFFVEFFKEKVHVRNLYALPLVFMISLLFILLVRKKQAKYYASFWVEGIPILWLLLLYFFL